MRWAVHWPFNFLSIGEPIIRSDIYGLLGFTFGVLSWMSSASVPFVSHLGTLMGGVCLGQVIRDRMQRAHERRMRQLQVDHDAALAELTTLDFETLLRMSQQPELIELRRCPRCHRVTYNSTDIKERYCGACHDWT